MDANKVSGREGGRVSLHDIQLVQNLIERCLQLYMSRKEVVETLADQAEIEPIFTNLVWQRLEEQNTEFFKAYHARLMVKHHVDVFNNLLKKQVDLMRKTYSHEAAPLPTSGASSATSCSYGFAAADLMPNRTVPLEYLPNGMTSLDPNVCTNLEPHLAGHIDTPPCTFTDIDSDMSILCDLLHQSDSGTVPLENLPNGMTSLNPNVCTNWEPHLLAGHIYTPPCAVTDIDSDMNIFCDSLLQLDSGDFIGQSCRNFSNSGLTAKLAEYGN